jgi:hypothetical protein
MNETVCRPPGFVGIGQGSTKVCDSHVRVLA